MSSAPKEAREIFTAAVEQYTPDQWSSYLDEACGDDVELRIERAERCDRRGENCRLRVGGELEVIFGTFEAELRQCFSERLIGLFERRTCCIRRIECVAAHADLLTALTRENECDLAHRVCP